jgi:hypothetical protein
MTVPAFGGSPKTTFVRRRYASFTYAIRLDSACCVCSPASLLPLLPNIGIFLGSDKGIYAQSRGHFGPAQCEAPTEPRQGSPSSLERNMSGTEPGFRRAPGRRRRAKHRPATSPRQRPPQLRRRAEVSSAGRDLAPGGAHSSLWPWGPASPVERPRISPVTRDVRNLGWRGVRSHFFLLTYSPTFYIFTQTFLAPFDEELPWRSERRW